MVFTEKDLLNAFKQNVDNKGWIYFVGNPDSNAKFIIDYMKEHKEEIDEEELDRLAWDEYLNVEDKDDFHWTRGFKAGYRKAMKK